MSDPFIGPTVTPVVSLPTAWQTDLQDLHNALITILSDFATTYPGYWRQVRHALPQSITAEGPFVYINRIRETPVYSGGMAGPSVAGDAIVASSFTGEIGYVDVIVDPEETDARVLVVRDAISQLFIVNARCLGNGVFYYRGMDDGPELGQGQNVRLTNVLFSWEYVLLRGDQGA